jgi:REP-associated tyrosine transposase
MNHRGFPSKLYHAVPGWVQPGALFHIRIRIDREKQQTELVTPPIAESLMDSAKFYEANQRWYITVFLLMPDHIHAILSFHRDSAMSRIIGEWKHFQTYEHGIIWQEGYFDHRLRDDERGEQLSAKINYIRQNPVAAGLCAKAADWPWWIERSALDDKSAGEAGK